jgi:serine/threonine protein kinase
MEIWGCEPKETHDQNREVLVGGCTVKLPSVAAKYTKFVKHRENIYREIKNMSQLGEHENVLQFLEVLELVQDSKCTLFLVLELAHGGELFDRIKIDCGTEEETARCYFKQLLSGVGFCHHHGVCHRDLKPENLLLASTDEGATLKIADFGLSAVFLSHHHEEEQTAGTTDSGLSMKRLTSVVGSPHYVAPEILENSGCKDGYDGTKSDVWSLGVILYAMLAGNLPFGKDILHCKRFAKYSSWVQMRNAHLLDTIAGSDSNSVLFPQWFFPPTFSDHAKDLISKLLQPDPSKRVTVEEAFRHAWIGIHADSSSVPLVDTHVDVDMLSNATLTSAGVGVEGSLETLHHHHPKDDVKQQKPGSDSGARQAHKLHIHNVAASETALSKPEEAQPDMKAIFESIGNDSMDLSNLEVPEQATRSRYTHTHIHGVCLTYVSLYHFCLLLVRKTHVKLFCLYSPPPPFAVCFLVRVPLPLTHLMMHMWETPSTNATTAVKTEAPMVRWHHNR